MTDRENQAIIHDALSAAMREAGLLGDGDFLTGWAVSFEYVGPNAYSAAGNLYGPAGQTSWGAIGLLEWARHCIDNPSAE